jgi:hypothetical protein
MSRAHRTTGVRDDAIIAFILLCLIGLYLFGAMASAVIFAITAVVCLERARAPSAIVTDMTAGIATGTEATSKIRTN